MLSKYCYGPVNILDVKKYENSMHVFASSSFGHSCKVVYENCIYWQIDESLKGKRLLIVEEKSVDELIRMRDSVCVISLKQNAANVEKLIRQWHEEGMHFYVHYTDTLQKEYLVVASKLDIEK